MEQRPTGGDIYLNGEKKKLKSSTLCLEAVDLVGDLKAAVQPGGQG